MGYKFYMIAVDKDGNTRSGATRKDLETDFSGLKYVSCTGLEDVGAAKNVYTEEYPENDGSRSFHPSDVSGGTLHYKETSIGLTLIFLGSTRRDTYNAFTKYLTESRLYYWDTARHKKVFLMYKESTEPTDDTLKNMEFIKVTYKFSNLWGIGKKCNDNGEIITSSQQ